MNEYTVKHRDWNNKLILKVLTEMLTENPEMRFGQACINLNLFPNLSDTEAGKVFNTESFESIQSWLVGNGK